MKPLELILSKILPFLVFILFIAFIWQNRFIYNSPFAFQNLTNLYNWSQFTPQNGHKIFTINDEDLYAFAGWSYLTTGKIGQINIEHPPLGKYFIGFSILFFHNQNIGQIFWGVLLLVLVYLLIFRISQEPLIATAVVLLVFLEPLFQEQLTHSLLDLSQMVFVFIYLLFLPKNTRISTLISGISLGAVAAIKFPALALIMALASFIAVFVQRKIQLQVKRLLIIYAIGLAVFVLCYLPFILTSGIFAWFELLLKALKIHLSHVPEYPKGVVWRILFLNQWPRWWGIKGYQTAPFWQLTWPIIGLAFVLNPFLVAKKKILKKEPEVILFVWFYLLFLSSRLFFPAYLLPILPFGFLFLFWLIQLFFRKKGYFSD
ncbi:hypothetical protein A2160_02835 [Candidatus Beckwithbacteria bacterium RBG_13_42_9]|uniref:Uncharacterized protein n=1 Tax=Candidatus Beckwithbacteria bacterium RBG_13_42_9 TaxID=1797457 RepID=A0A1F5E7R4_9BACT|nr:MAG: hypothetical protein A2160_02835 [Candidatus Beckwithbacteria bacterium RBG_13_42_9]